MSLVEEKINVQRRCGSPPTIDPDSDAILLDIDGTIIDIAPTPEAVEVPESLKHNLSRMRENLNGALALITGRSIATIDELFAPLKFVAVGCHGAEFRRIPNGEIEQHARPLSNATKRKFAEVGRLDPRIRIEDKRYTLAVHYRRAPELENAIFGIVNERMISISKDFEIVSGKDAIEIKAHDFNKGTGLRRIMGNKPFSGRRPIFLGDDTTDEDAFAVLPQFHGFGISVGRLLPGAQEWMPSPAYVRCWLARSAEQNR